MGLTCFASGTIKSPEAVPKKIHSAEPQRYSGFHLTERTVVLYKTNGRAIQKIHFGVNVKEIAITKAAVNRVARGERTRLQILEVAVDIASAEGLEGLTIGRLAQELQMSKSGLFAHFGSKEELQIATIEMARDIFVREIVDPSSEFGRGIGRLQAMLEMWLSYVERNIFKGGCFFAAAAAEFDSRPGAVRDLIMKLCRSWLNMIEGEVRQSQTLGHINESIDATQLAFELHALAQGANWAYQLFSDKRAFARAREGIKRSLQQSSLPAGQQLLQSSVGRAGKSASRRAK